ncbi:alpha/beta fold hydrolase [Yoonia tamlensis]|nr:alpha/beta hydrolase [Yoonia tamlensis]
MWYYWVLGVLAGLAILPVYLERRCKPVSDYDRSQTAGDLARLSQGLTHYRWVGPARGPVAVIVHGMSTSSASISGFAQGLGEMGYRVLVYDLYGRGLSDNVAGRQDRAYFLRQLTDLLAFHRLSEDITLVGYSMGGAIATAYSAQNPHCIKRLILIAATGVVTTEGRFARFCRKTPVLGDWLHAVLARRRLSRAIPRVGPSSMAGKVYASQRLELRRRGFMPSLLKSSRGMLYEVQEKDHRRLGRVDVPTIAIWAEHDQIIPIQALGVLAQWHRDIHQEVVAGADHAMPYTHCPQLLQALVRAMRP